MSDCVVVDWGCGWFIVYILPVFTTELNWSSIFREERISVRLVVLVIDCIVVTNM